MNLTILHSRFKLNLVDTSFTMIEENNWFTDQLFSKYTYPISKILTDEEDAALEFITELNAQGVNTIYDVLFYVLDQEHQAVMEIEVIQGSKIEFQIRYGFEDFPNFEKKLAQLPLHKFDLESETIYEHALSKISLGYPATDYNFQRVFTDKFDTESPQWEAFEGSINNYTGSAFLINEYDPSEDKQINRNIMQPIPSLLYVLKTGFAEKGYTLAGDILDDPDFKRAWLYSLSDYYSTIQDNQKQEMMMTVDENSGVSPSGPSSYHYIFEKEITIIEPGRYKIAGNLFLQPPKDSVYYFRFSQASILLDNNPIGYWDARGENESFKFLDMNFEINPAQSNITLKFIALSSNYRVIGDTRVFDAPILDVTVSQLTKYRPDGSAEPTLVLPNEIDLTQCVPDVTFGDLYKAIKQWKNYSADIVGNIVYMNRVQNQLGKGKVKDLSHKEVQEPRRTTNQGKSFELKFSEISSEEYSFPSMYIDRKGYTLEPYTKKSDTEEILIEAIPLPRKTQQSITTAHGFLDDQQKIQIILYEGLTGALNTTQEPTNLLIPSIYENYYKQWIDFLLKTIGYEWSFQDFDINISDLHDKTTVFAYGKHHTVVKLTKKNLGIDGIIETEIETSSLE